MPGHTSKLAQAFLVDMEASTCVERQEGVREEEREGRKNWVETRFGGGFVVLTPQS